MINHHRNIHTKKIILRQQANTRINNLSLEDINHKSKCIIEQLRVLDIANISNNFCVYCSLSREVQTDEFIMYLLNQHKNVAIPRITNENLTLHYISSLADVRISSHRIREPINTYEPIDAKDIDVFVIPGLAFDRFGTRLGRSKGYYDKVLQGVTAPKIGLAFSEQIFPLLPKNNHDIVMDIIITDIEVINVNNLYEKNTTTP